MVQVCPHGGGEHLQKNGHTPRGAQRARCVECRRTFTLSPEGPKHRQQVKAQVLAAYQDRLSLRGIGRPLRSLLHDRHALAGGEKPGLCPPTRTRCCPLKRAACWRWTNSGASCKACSFSKHPENHRDAIHFFIANYNLQIKQ